MAINRLVVDEKRLAEKGIINEKDGGKFSKFFEKFSKGNIIGDTVDAFKSVGKDFVSSIMDTIKSKNDRNAKDANSEFEQVEVSMANRHKEVIGGILEDVYNGNLFDAGLSAINLYNKGTKWWVYTDQHVDKELYPFRYYYHEDFKNKAGARTSETSLLNLLDSIEDPTVLGYALKIDYDNSPLFTAKDTKASIHDFIDSYRGLHSELEYVETYWDEFTKGARLIFESIETLSNANDRYRSTPYKNHYVSRIDGLDKLDNMFVSTRDDGTMDELKLTLYEDVRMFSTHLAMLYNNMVFSYHMGKRLVPENLLRFNLYIKMSDQRPFTHGTTDGDPMRDAIRNQYSRVIYELRDCEFVFENNLPSTLTMGGLGVTDASFASVNLKIKYRKVNRFFYSSLFDGNMRESVISDKYTKPSTERTIQYIRGMKMAGKKPTTPNGMDGSKRKHTSNTIAVKPSLRDTYNGLKNNGLFVGEDNDDTALERFAKGLGNKAVKAGMELVDEGLQVVRKEVDKVGLGVRDKLRKVIVTKTTKLGTVYTKKDHAIDKPSTVWLDEYVGVIDTTPPSIDLHPNSDAGVVKSPTGDLMGDVNLEVTAPKADLMDVVAQKTSAPTGDLMGDVNLEVTAPKADLMEDVNLKVTAPKADLMEEVAQKTTAPKADLMGDVNLEVTTPKADLMEDVNQKTTAPKADLMGDVNLKVTAPKADLMEDVNLKVTAPKADLMENVNQKTTAPAGDLMGDVNLEVTAPKADLMENANQKTTAPAGDLMGDVNLEVSAPNADLMEDVNQKTAAPAGDLMGDVNLEVTAPKADLMEDVNQKTTAPNDDLMGDVNLEVTAPGEDLMGDVNLEVTAPNADLMENVNQRTTAPNDDLMGDVNLVVDAPDEDLMEGVNQKTTAPNDDLMGDANLGVTAPSEDLMGDADRTVEAPKADLMDVVNLEVTAPSEDLMKDANQKTIAPKADLMADENHIVTAPSEDLMGDAGHTVEAPNEDLHVFKKFLRK
jgi:hypothetical protein